jgi:hypothetical protein
MYRRTTGSALFNSPCISGCLQRFFLNSGLRDMSKHSRTNFTQIAMYTVQTNYRRLMLASNSPNGSPDPEMYMQQSLRPLHSPWPAAPPGLASSPLLFNTTASPSLLSASASPTGLCALPSSPADLLLSLNSTSKSPESAALADLHPFSPYPSAMPPGELNADVPAHAKQVFPIRSDFDSCHSCKSCTATEYAVNLLPDS